MPVDSPKDTFDPTRNNGPTISGTNPQPPPAPTRPYTPRRLAAANPNASQTSIDSDTLAQTLTAAMSQMTSQWRSNLTNTIQKPSS